MNNFNLYNDVVQVLIGDLPIEFEFVKAIALVFFVVLIFLVFLSPLALAKKIVDR